MKTLESIYNDGVNVDGPEGSVELTHAKSGWWFVRCHTRHIKEVFDEYESAYYWLVDNGYDTSKIPNPETDITYE